MSRMINVLTAAIGGFIAGILLAPKSGKETREDLMNKAREAKDVATEQVDRVKDGVKEGYESMRSNAQDAAKEAKEFGQSVKQSASDLKAEAEARRARTKS